MIEASILGQLVYFSENQNVYSKYMCNNDFIVYAELVPSINTHQIVLVTSDFWHYNVEYEKENNIACLDVILLSTNFSYIVRPNKSCIHFL